MVLVGGTKADVVAFTRAGLEKVDFAVERRSTHRARMSILYRVLAVNPSNAIVVARVDLATGFPVGPCRLT
jgi:hypothetical protein